jgi:4-amino-4-deoxy-L-arabinose transferase-like glycosyltransferase
VGQTRSLTVRSLAPAVTVAGLVTLVALRLVLIHASLPDILYWEEPYRLTIAREVLNGPHLPLAEYQADHYQGGSLVVGLLAVPFVAAFGPTYAALKLVPLAFTVATAVLWTLLLWRAVGPLAAAVGAWLLALAPPFAQVYQVHAMGSHAESALFSAAAFVLTLALVRSVRGRVLPFLLGLTAGLGLWFCYTVATAIAACALVWLWRRPRDVFGPALLPLLGGAAVGLVPWLGYNLTHGFSGIDRLTELFDPLQREAATVREPLVTRVTALAAVDLPNALGFQDGIAGLPGPAAWAYYGLLIVALGSVALIALRGRTRERKTMLATLMSAYVALHLLAYVVSSFRLDVESGFIAYRFFAPLFPVAAALLAMTVAHLLEPPTQLAAGRDARAVGIGVLVLALALGGYGFASLVREHVADETPPFDSGYKLMGVLTQLKYRDHIERAFDLLGRLPDHPRALALFGVGWGLEFQYEKDGNWPALATAATVTTLPSDGAAVLEGLRWGVVQTEKKSRAYANAGFRPDYHANLHRRVSELAAHVHELTQTARTTMPVAAALR